MKEILDKINQQKNEFKATDKNLTGVGITPEDLSKINKSNMVRFDSKEEKQKLGNLQLHISTSLQQSEPVVYWKEDFEKFFLGMPSPEKVKEFVEQNFEYRKTRTDLADKQVKGMIKLPFGVTKVEYEFIDEAKDLISSDEWFYTGKVEDRIVEKDSGQMPVEMLGTRSVITKEAKNNSLDLEKESEEHMKNALMRKLDESIAKGFLEYPIVASKVSDSGEITGTREIGTKRKYFDKVMLKSIHEKMSTQKYRALEGQP